MPELGTETLALFSIGQRDARLLALRERIFGPTLASQSTCPECGESLEQTFTVDDIRVPAAGGSTTVCRWTSTRMPCHFRLPNSQDLAALAPFEDVSVARARLVERCLLATSPERARAGRHFRSRSCTRSPNGWHRRTPGDIQLALACPRCSREWVESFDIVSFLWSELAAWASRHARRGASAGMRVRVARGGHPGDEPMAP